MHAIKHQIEQLKKLIEESKAEVDIDSDKIKDVSLEYDQTTLSLEFVALDYSLK